MGNQKLVVMNRVMPGGASVEGLLVLRYVYRPRGLRPLRAIPQRVQVGTQERCGRLG